MSRKEAPVTNCMLFHLWWNIRPPGVLCTLRLPFPMHEHMNNSAFCWYLSKTAECWAAFPSSRNYQQPKNRQLEFRDRKCTVIDLLAGSNGFGWKLVPRMASYLVWFALVLCKRSRMDQTGTDFSSISGNRTHKYVLT